MIDALIALAILIIAIVDSLRWLRVAQREHYIAGSVTRFALRWRRVGIGLRLRGRTSKLAWTRRLKVLTALVAIGHVGVVLAFDALVPLSVASLLALLLLPVTVDGALFLAAPIEARLLGPFVKRATQKLRTVDPTIVAITGSYGKTSTKVVMAHLIAGTRSVAASPASFNNRAGLARAVNEGLTAGTDVFIAEMGTYGPGEIAALCQWCPPSIAVITAIGPVHLERFGTEDAIVTAKSEIMVTASTVVLNVDDERLGALADATTDKKVVRVSGRRSDVDVAIVDGDVFVHSERVGHVEQLPTAATNAACAVAVALELGVSGVDAAARLASAPGAAHRLEATTAPSGVVVLDDTFNSNPAGARRALDALGAAGAAGGRRALITPGMIELGKRQFEENVKFAEAAGQVATMIGIVGKTNAAALAKGAAANALSVQRFADREEAVAWVRASLGTGDVVLYENDLPDHFA